MSAEFVHLHVHSEYSILDGACRIPALAARAAELEMPAVALTDHGSLAGAVDLYRAARDQGVKPIVGCEVYVADDRRARTRGYAHLTLLARDNTGYGNLIKLSSLGYLEGYYTKPRVDWELLERHSSGLIALSGCLSGRVCKALEENRPADARADLDRLAQVFGRDNTYVELQNAGLEVQQRVNPELVKLAAEAKLPLVATGDVHYLNATDAYSHEALLCIQSGDSLKNPNHWRFDTNEFYFKTPAEMALDFPGHEDAMRRTLEVAERCSIELELGKILLPKFPTPNGRDAFEYLVELCEQGLERRYDKVGPELRERLQFELKTIKEMGFADYFLIVWDFIRFAKQNGIGVGPGRGSAAGSLAAYALEITDIDPIAYDLLFERFLNPGRKEMPDIDIDFAVEGRERVINYVSEKYGRDRVAQIITFGTMAARAAVRDAGRVLEIPYGVVDKIAKLIPEGPGQTLADCLKTGDLKDAYETDPAAKEIVDLAKPLEGLVRQDSIHAAGVVIGAEPLIDVVPLQQKGPDQEVVTQFSMNTVSALGLLKMDFLGLRNLDVIDKAVALVGNVDMNAIPLDDKKTYAMLARGEAMGVFQFESSGMRDALKQVKPTVFEDLIALVALYRPGPMQYIPNYARRKAGQEPVSFIDPRLKEITGDTYGTCLTGDTLVFDAASGRRRRLDELAEHAEVRVQGVDGDFRTRHARISHWIDNGRRPIYRLRLRNGSTIKATADHRFLTEHGWSELRNLRPGDHIGAPRKLETVAEGASLSERDRARVRVLAYLLGDGSLTHGQPSFFSSDDALLADFEASCLLGFSDIILKRHAKARRVTQIGVAKVPGSAAYHDPSSLDAWLRQHGLRWKPSERRVGGSTRRGESSETKFVPEWIFELADEEIARFLAAMWDCDGHIDERCSFLKTISRRMATDVQTLLLRVGVRSTIYESTYEAAESGIRVKRTAYQVTTCGTRDFARIVQPHMRSFKRDVLTAAADGGLSVSRSLAFAEIRRATDGLEPQGVERRRNGALSARAVATRIGIDRQQFLPRAMKRPRVGVSSLGSALELLDLPSTTRAARLAWHEIVDVEPAGEAQVFDITVEGIHNFVANDIIVHNCIYQEQSMEIAKRIAGFEPAEADDLRKAIAKKKHALMASLKDKFITGCIANQTSEAVARQLWDDIEKSQDYSFNKSHAACYALIAYRTAWLKANHPCEYMAALISSVMSTKDRVPLYVNACDELGIEVLPPDVNTSQTDFAVVEGKIRFGLNAVKAVGETAARAIVAAREAGGPFESIWDFTERVDPQVVNKRSLEALIKCGALDSTGASRMGMLACLEQALSWGQKHAADRLAGQASIFDMGQEEEQAPKHHPAIPSGEFEKPELLKLEKETLGLYVSEHPLHAVRDQLRRKTDCTLAELEKRRDGEVVVVGGIVSAVKQLTTKKGEPMVFLTLDDPTGGGEVVVFNSTYAQARELCVADRILVVKGRIDHKQQGETKLIALEVSAFEAVQERTEIRFKLDAREARAGLVRELAQLVKSYPGPSRVVVALETSLGPKTLALGAGYTVAIDTDFLTEARHLLGADAIV